MKNALNLLNACLILLILSSCKNYEPPKGELCIIGDAGGICYDIRLPEGEREYILPHDEMINYIATNPDDWAAQNIWWLGILEKLEKCERGLNKKIFFSRKPYHDL